MTHMKAKLKKVKIERKGIAEFILDNLNGNTTGRVPGRNLRAIRSITRVIRFTNRVGRSYARRTEQTRECGTAENNSGSPVKEAKKNSV